MKTAFTGAQRAEMVRRAFPAARLRSSGFLAALERWTPGEFRAESTGIRGSLYLYEEIGETWWGTGTSAKSVVEAMAELRASGVKALDIFINSPGGNIWEAKAIFAELKRFDGERHVHIDGIAASAASFIAMAGDKIITAPAATWMIHDVWAGGYGNADDHRKLADLLELESSSFAEVYAARSGQTVDDVRAWMRAETWMNASTAHERGFTDEVSSAAKPDDDSADVAAAMTAVSTLRAIRAA